jgi:DNA-binding transcriptional LysR family regulator
MELRQLRHFIAIAEEGSFSRAAQRLHVSQPPLSTQMKSLEDELGVRLLTRSHRGVALTAAGTAFPAEARVVSPVWSMPAARRCGRSAAKRGCCR